VNSRCTVRAATPNDLAALVDLLEAYMRETYRDTWHGSMNSLQRDAFGKECTIHVAEVGGHVVGFVAWTNSYDLHHCLTGGDILDLYVRPSWRGLGFAPALLCSAAAELLRRGATHLKGGAVDRGTGEHLRWIHRQRSRVPEAGGARRGFAEAASAITSAEDLELRGLTANRRLA
jgi:GNAT superfamily N-acetyltransferase